jgi:diguanylate cyclase (GGDEF)-like protein
MRPLFHPPTEFIEMSPSKGATKQDLSLIRTFSAVLVVVVAGVGIWGTFSTYAAVRANERAKRLESGYEQLRYALALERSALRDSNTVRSQRELARASSAFVEGVDLVRSQDTELARTIEHRHAEVATAAVLAFAQRERAPELDMSAASLDARLSHELTAIRERNASRWPGRPTEKLAAAALAVLLALGLATCGVALVRLVSHRRRRTRARREEFIRLREAALTDSLTGLGNHRSFHEDLRREIARRTRSGSCFSLVMLDLNGLKQLNDRLGHQAGDERIQAVADCLRATMRATDAAYRTGGDEFMILLPNERAWGALEFARRLQEETLRNPTKPAVTCGITESVAFETADTLLQRADLALYDAKRSARQIVLYADGLAPKPAANPEAGATRREHRLLATALARAVDAKDAGTRNHCETVSELCVLIGQALGLDAERIERLRLAGLLHDVGKIGVSDGILRKPGRLDEDEAAEMSSHVRVGHAIVAAAELEEEARWVRHHHEHFDGSGYPDGLSGEEIPPESRIILVADAFEAMTADRPYRRARPVLEALAELDRLSGTQFDPACVDALRFALGITEIHSQVDAA